MTGLKRQAFSAVFALAACALVIAAAPITINLSTFAPAHSEWHEELLDLGEAWSKATAGRVTLKVFAGGTQGPEDKVVSMMRPGVDHLQGALLLQPGLADIEDSANVFGM